MTSEPVLILGAGVTGLAAARSLEDRGVSVVVVDKGRGVGGRLATRRFPDGSAFDHGAALFDAVSEPFRRRLSQWESEGLVERLRGGTGTFRVRGPATRLAKHLARGLDVRLGAKATALIAEGGGLAVTFENGPALRGAAAVLTAPVPQSLELVAAGGVLDSLAGGLRASLEAVAYHPAFVLLLRLDKRVPVPSGGLTLRDGGPISRILENARDGGPSRLSVYARETWARKRFEAPADEVAPALRAATAVALGFDLDAVAEEDLKRWRYARAATLFAEPIAVGRIGGAPVVFAGDAFGLPSDAHPEFPPLDGNSGVERGFLSGLAAAAEIRGF
ncbi:MAG: FAD-dependent oxidoreductase [Acidobacteriota bacterium]